MSFGRINSYFDGELHEARHVFSCFHLHIKHRPANDAHLDNFRRDILIPSILGRNFVQTSSPETRQKCAFNWKPRRWAWDWWSGRAMLCSLSHRLRSNLLMEIFVIYFNALLMCWLFSLFYVHSALASSHFSWPPLVYATFLKTRFRFLLSSRVHLGWARWWAD